MRYPLCLRRKGGPVAVECGLAIQFLPGGSRGSNPALYDGGDEVAEEVAAPVQLGWAAIFASHSWMGFFLSSCVFSQSIRKLYAYAVTLLDRVLTLPCLEAISTSCAFRNSSSSACSASSSGSRSGRGMVCLRLREGGKEEEGGVDRQLSKSEVCMEEGGRCMASMSIGYWRWSMPSNRVEA